MPRSRTFLLCPAAALVILLLTGAPASAEERVCRGTLGAVTVDNLRVPPGASCRLTGTRAKGTIKVERDGTLVANRVVVIGNVQAENARSVSVLDRSRVGGSIQIKQGGGATVSNSFVDGNIQLESNRLQLRVNSNTVGADVQAFQNRGGVSIRSNRIDGNLQCKSNSPAPTGGGNVVQGNKEDQCRRL
jgi:hypothetical protein